MNNARRKELAKAVNLLQRADELVKEAAEILEFERDAEQEAFDNMPEGLQGSERGDLAQEAIDCLETAVDYVASFDVEEIVSQIEQACGQ